MLAEGLVEFCLADPRVEACRVVIRKPEVYPGSATPEITVYRLRTPSTTASCVLVPQ